MRNRKFRETPSTPDVPQSHEETKVSDAPKTGDNTNIWLPILLLVIPTMEAWQDFISAERKSENSNPNLSKGGPESGLPLKYKNSQKGTEKYDENNGKETGSKKEPGENFKKNDGLSEKSGADGQQEKNEPSHD